MLLTSANFEDIAKYFAGTFVTLPEYENKILLIDKVIPEAVLMQDEEGNRLCIELDGATTGKTEYLLNYIIPKKTYFQAGPYAYFLTRIPAKQWKKGVSKQNTTIWVLLEDKFSSQQIDFKNLKSYVEKPAYSSIDELSGYHTSLALSNRIAVARSTGIIYCDAVAIGRYKKEDGIVLVKKLFQKEIEMVFPGKKVYLL